MVRKPAHLRRGRRYLPISMSRFFHLIEGPSEVTVRGNGEPYFSNYLHVFLDNGRIVVNLLSSIRFDRCGDMLVVPSPHSRSLQKLGFGEMKLP
jgi:hypothetical protein